MRVREKIEIKMTEKISRKERITISSNVAGVFKDAENADWSSGSYDLKAPDNSYIPSSSGPFTAGKNYFDPVEKFLYVVLTGKKVIEIKMKPGLVTAFQSFTVLLITFLPLCH